MKVEKGDGQRVAEGGEVTESLRPVGHKLNGGASPTHWNYFVR